WMLAVLIAKQHFGEKEAKIFNFVQPGEHAMWSITGWQDIGGVQLWFSAYRFPKDSPGPTEADFHGPEGVPPSWSRAQHAPERFIGTADSMFVESARGWPCVAMLATYHLTYRDGSLTKSHITHGIDLDSHDPDPINALLWRALPLKP